LRERLRWRRQCRRNINQPPERRALFVRARARSLGLYLRVNIDSIVAAAVLIIIRYLQLSHRAHVNWRNEYIQCNDYIFFLPLHRQPVNMVIYFHFISFWKTMVVVTYTLMRFRYYWVLHGSSHHPYVIYFVLGRCADLSFILKKHNFIAIKVFIQLFLSSSPSPRVLTANEGVVGILTFL